MDVVYEDYLAVVMLRDGNHRTAEQRRDDGNALKHAKAHWGA
jgi:hypothetical protein